ncbi:putative enzyme [uncultured Alphaproteobacteria bacterium]|uniref:Putative enzyme n=1 Tax=uncultured Alphaproteobacteria bacterium TaxID=91750 RepID=A0A212JJR6_9PROT|nr:putative enzyme [uncultured Alphaproteobacteria bacterium]
MRLAYSVVDAFTDTPFKGNPAAVLKLDAFLPDATLQAIAAEFNLSETAFVVADGADWKLRWFTPAVEVPLCGHATLATGFVLRRMGFPAPLRFHTLSGALAVGEADGRLVLDFPAWVPAPATPPAGLAEALGAEPVEVYKARDWICVFRTPAEVEALTPDHAKIAALDGERVIATAAADDTCVIATAPGGARADVTSRYFAAKVGIPEDPVTGAAHTQLAPFWSARLGKARLTCRQASARGGWLWTEVRGDRVAIAGHAVAVAEGVIEIPG